MAKTIEIRMVLTIDEESKSAMKDANETKRLIVSGILKRSLERQKGILKANVSFHEFEYLVNKMDKMLNEAFSKHLHLNEDNLRFKMNPNSFYKLHEEMGFTKEEIQFSPLSVFAKFKGVDIYVDKLIADDVIYLQQKLDFTHLT